MLSISEAQQHPLAGVTGLRAAPSYLLGAPLDAAVLARHVLAVPVVGRAAGETEVGVALADGQVARALLRVALGFAAAAGEAVLTFRETPRQGRTAQRPHRARTARHSPTVVAREGKREGRQSHPRRRRPPPSCSATGVRGGLRTYSAVITRGEAGSGLRDTRAPQLLSVRALGASLVSRLQCTVTVLTRKALHPSL